MSRQEVLILADPFYSSSSWNQEILAGFREAAAKNRTDLQIRVRNMEEVAQLAPEAGSPVVLTNSSLHNLTAAIRLLQQRGVQVLLSGVDGAYFGPNVSSVTSDRTMAMTQMVQYLVSNGRSRIALVGFWPSSKNDMAFLDAALAAAQQLGVSIGKESCYFWEHLVSESLDAFLENRERYDAVICPNDTIAICLARACRENRIRIPEDLFITGSSNMRISQEFEPSITTIGMDFREIGAETYYAWEHLRQREVRCSSIRLSIAAPIIPRESTGSLPLRERKNLTACALAAAMESGNRFFTDPMIKSLIRFEDCLGNWDETDQKLIMAILQGKSYEQMEDMLFMSSSAIRYRRNRIYRDAGVSSRAEFEKLLTELYSI